MVSGGMVFSRPVYKEGFPGVPVVKNLPAKAGEDPWVGKLPWRRVWQPSPAFLPGETPWIAEPGGLQSMESQRVGHDLATEQQ